MSTYVVTVCGWLAENEYQYGGTPEYVEGLTVEAPSFRAAETFAIALFGLKRPDCTHIEADNVTEI